MSCFKIVFDNDEDLNSAIEIHHPPEAIEEVEVPVYERFEHLEIERGLTHYFIKLKACKNCGLYVREE